MTNSKINKIHFKISLDINEHTATGKEARVISVEIEGHESDLKNQKSTMQFLLDTIFGKLVYRGEFLGIEFAIPENAIPGHTGNFSIGLDMIVEYEDGTTKEFPVPASFDSSPELYFDVDELKESEEIFNEFINHNSLSNSNENIAESLNKEREDTAKKEEHIEQEED